MFTSLGTLHQHGSGYNNVKTVQMTARVNELNVGEILIVIAMGAIVWLIAFRRSEQTRNNRSPIDEPKGKIIWADDSCWMVYHLGDSTQKPYLELVHPTNGGNVVFTVIGNDIDPNLYPDSCIYEPETSLDNGEDALAEGLSALDAQGYTPTYWDKVDESYGCEFGEYGSNPQWLDELRHVPSSKRPRD